MKPSSPAPSQPDERQPGAGSPKLGSARAAGAVITALNGLIMLLVCIGNVTDYDANLAFVRHVLAMDTTNFGAAPGTALDPDVMWRATTSPALQTAAYVIIIVWECLTAAILVYASALWVRAARTSGFAAARGWSSIGLLLMVVLFVGGFIAIGGEWFQMWRSDDWNGIESAFRYSVLALLGLVMLHLPAGERQNPDTWDAPA